ncbi:MAG: DUF1549 and DUF1553 domain-containing protein [Pirellulales bacterium]|nr:DUF1549 and DUF1553 domain-containing protein [Pirellulales bacterium]
MRTFLYGCTAIVAGLATIGIDEAATGQDSRPDDRVSGAMSRRIDQLLSQSWSEAGITPADNATDVEFLRRVTLDLTGTLPRVSDVRSFLADTKPDKRRRRIERLLASPRHASHLANTWVGFLLPEEEDPFGLGGDQGIFHEWLRERFASNLRYDNLVADLLVADGEGDEAGPAVFYTSLDVMPEKIAASTADIFLGVQIGCAQCHDHPFADWKQEEFWGYAAFFARVQPDAPNMIGDIPMLGGARLRDVDEGEVTLPETETVVPPTFLGGQQPDANVSNRRRELAIWLASNSNPYFAKATVNRVWAQLFGRPLAEPIDNLDLVETPQHAQLLQDLADSFVASEYDLRELYRTLANSQAYQLTSRSETDDTYEMTSRFARMAIKNLSAEQLYDALLMATRLRADINEPSPDENAILFQRDPARAEFVARFRGVGAGADEYRSGIPQALSIMNGQTVTSGTELGATGTLAGLTAPFLSDGQRVEILFLATLSRRPYETERSKFAEYVSSGGATGSQEQALGDVLWAIVNSAEFTFNH